ncbi:MAG: cofactor-independent phosphoglycerate mutase [Peptococcaceae bacterium]|jgi:2,3-bisphosphoglycerate-independent phosphoglycerate mutase|nr:cofactor-independent phosphoglycerate mutase [Peptococcaceae bacterium]
MESVRKKYVLVLADGMADTPVAALNGKTPMQAAHKPHMDQLAKKGVVGMVKTIPDGMSTGSDTANMAVMGYDPRKYYTGRSPFEAYSMGLRLEDADVSFRCNLVHVSEETPYEEKIMLDHSSDEISTEEAAELIRTVQSELGAERMRFYPGVSYRHILLWKDAPWDFEFTPPHDILGRRVGDYMPKGAYGGKFCQMIKDSYRFLEAQPVNRRRKERGLLTANSIWIWGEGKRPAIQSFKEKYGLSGAVISAVDLIKGLGLCAGMDSIDVEGVTGTYRTNYKGKLQAALDALDSGKDFVYIHLEGPDECGHRAETANKVTAIERIDGEIVGPLMAALDKSGAPFSLMVTPDHPTPLNLRTHTNSPVPFLIYDSENPTEKPLQVFDEEGAAKTGVFYPEGYLLMDGFLKHA